MAKKTKPPEIPHANNKQVGANGDALGYTIKEPTQKDVATHDGAKCHFEKPVEITITSSYAFVKPLMPPTLLRFTANVEDSNNVNLFTKGETQKTPEIETKVNDSFLSELAVNFSQAAQDERKKLLKEVAAVSCDKATVLTKEDIIKMADANITMNTPAPTSISAPALPASAPANKSSAPKKR